MSGRTAAADAYNDLRVMVLRLDPKSAGIAPTPDLPRVWGVLFDWNLDKGVATTVSLADGTTSMYLSMGGGFIGAGQHAEPAAASISALAAAEAVLDRFPSAEAAPLPPAGRSAFVVLTYSGLRRVEASNSDLAAGRSPIASVANAMQDVISAIRRAEPRDS